MRETMIELGKRQKLKIVKEVEFGVYLGDEKEKVLLPKKQVPEGAKNAETDGGGDGSFISFGCDGYRSLSGLGIGERSVFAV